MPPGKETVLLLLLAAIVLGQDPNILSRTPHTGSWGPTWYITAPGNTPKDTWINVTVVEDPAWLARRGLMDIQAEVKDILTKTFTDVNSRFFKITAFNYHTYYDGIVGDLNYKHIHILITLGFCKDSHDLNYPVDNYNDLLHVGITDSFCPRLKGPAMTLPVLHEGEDLNQLMLELKTDKMMLGSWDSFNIIMDNTVSKAVENDILDIMMNDEAIQHNSNMTFNVRRFTQGQADLSTAIKFVHEMNIAETSGKTMFIVSNKKVYNFVSALHHLQLLKHIHHEFLFVMLDTNDRHHGNIDKFFEFGGEGVNLAFLYNVTKTDGMTCPRGGQQILCLVKNLGNPLFRSIDQVLEDEVDQYEKADDLDWYDLWRPKIRDRFTKIFNGWKIPLEDETDCFQCVKYKMETVEGTWGAPELQSDHGSKEFRRLDVGTWSQFGGRINDVLFPAARHGFRNRNLSVACIEYPPWNTYIRDNVTNRITGYTGLMFTLLDNFGKKYNFTYTVTEPQDGALWGDKVDGEWQGMTKMIASGQAAFSATPFPETHRRSEVLSFTYPLDIQGYAFLYKKPTKIGKETILVDPFEWEVWLGLAIFSVILGPIFYFNHQMSYYYHYYDEVSEYGLFQFWRCTLFYFGMIIQQGSNQMPQSPTGRVYLTGWFLLILVILSFYQGALVAMIAIPQQEFELNNIETLVKKDYTYNWAFLEGSDIERYFMQSPDKAYRKVGRKAKRLQWEDIWAMDSGIYRKISGKMMAYIDNHGFIQGLYWRQYQNTTHCNYTFSRERFFYQNLGVALPKDSAWTPLFSKDTKTLFHSGVTDQWKRQHWPPENECDMPYKPRFDGIEISKILDMQGAFYVLFGGFFIASWILFGEWQHFKKHKDDPWPDEAEEKRMQPYYDFLKSKGNPWPGWPDEQYKREFEERRMAKKLADAKMLASLNPNKKWWML